MPGSTNDQTSDFVDNDGANTYNPTRIAAPGREGWRRPGVEAGRRERLSLKRLAHVGLRVRVYMLLSVAACGACVLVAVVGAHWAASLAVGLAAASLGWLAVDQLLLGRLRDLAQHSHQAAHGEYAEEPPQAPSPDAFAAIERDLDAMSAGIRTRDAQLLDFEDAIRSNEARYRDLFESNPHPMVVFDVETMEILAANDAAIRRYGFSRQQFLRMTIRHLFPEPFTLGIQALLERMAVDQERSVEDRHRRRDGAVIDVEVMSHRIRFAGRPAALAMFADISQRKKAEAETRRRTEAIAALYESAREQASRMGRAEMASVVVRSAVERFGAHAAWLGIAEADGSVRLLAAFPECTAETVSVRWDDTDGGNGPTARALREREPVVYPGDGTPFEPGPWVNQEADQVLEGGIAIPLALGDRGFGVLHLLSDTTDALTAERVDVLTSYAIQAAASLTRADYHERLQEMIEGLEQRVRERTADLQLANRELEAFSYSVSHDLRAPLRGVDGFSRLALTDHGAKMPPEARRYLEMIRCNVAEMNDLITALLSFSRTARQRLDVREVRPAEIVASVIDALRREAENRVIDFRVGDLPPCQADPTLLKQVYANLISNAVKFTAHRSPAVVEIGSMREAGAVVYYVRDNGVGFDPARADRLFGVFQRLHRAEEFPGTGVGLATVQRIVGRHGGRIWFEAKPNEGAAFFFTVAAES